MTTPTTTTLALQCLQSASGITARAGTRFKCRHNTQFFKGCGWDALAGLEKRNARESACLRAYNDEGATSLRSDVKCNAGSQGVGSHCDGSNHDLVDNYCSHCPRGESAGSHGRMGCGHDQHGYGHAGALWIR